MRTRRSQSSGNPVSSTPKGTSPSSQDGHIPVLLHEALYMLDIHPDDIVVDATLGGAGHARAIADKLGLQGIFIGFDLDADAIERSRKALEKVLPRTHLIQANFRDMSAQLARVGITGITKALFDLGWSSYQLDSRLRQDFGVQAGRG